MSQPFGLYFHIPFCSALCHYCDFAKTANFSADQVRNYFAQLERHFLIFQKAQGVQEGALSSVFFGGGTPGLYGEEYRSLLKTVLPFRSADAEISLEANPQNITRERLQIWRDVGFNRLSIGVQTFDAAGLEFLKRDHDVEASRQAIKWAATAFTNYNIDLIYAWPGQTLEIWERDLDQAIAYGVPHLSLYALTYEARTPIGRQQARGRIQATGDDEQAAFYQLAREKLARSGYQHDEVSNWSRPGFDCHHNTIYWQDHSYIGIGVGAHGYRQDAQSIGERWSYPPALKTFLAMVDHAPGIHPFPELLEAERDLESWLLEYVGCGLRCRWGIDLGRVAAVTGRLFVPRPSVQAALSRGILTLYEGTILRLRSDEWFREAAWSLEVAMSFPMPK